MAQRSLSSSVVQILVVLVLSLALLAGCSGGEGGGVSSGGSDDLAFGFGGEPMAPEEFAVVPRALPVAVLSGAFPPLVANRLLGRGDAVGALGPVPSPAASAYVPSGTLPPVSNQGNLSSCGGFGIAYGLGSWSYGIANGVSPHTAAQQVSASFNYARALSLEGDSGCTGTRGASYLYPLTETGSVSTETDPPPALGNGTSMCNSLPPYTSFTPSPSYGIGTYATLDQTNQAELKAYLAQGVPFAGLFVVHADLNDVGSGVYKASGAITDNHFMMVIGYDDSVAYTDAQGNPAQGAFWLQNSWGRKDFGQEGYFWMGYEAFASTALEAWTVVPNDPPAPSGTDAAFTVTGTGPAGRIFAVGQAQDPGTGNYHLVLGVTFANAIYQTSSSAAGPDGTVPGPATEQWLRTGYLSFAGGTEPFPAGSYDITVTSEKGTFTATVTLGGNT